MRLPTLRKSRDRPSHCLECGYSLRGNISDRCSECGTPIESDRAVHLPLENAPRKIIFAFAVRMTAVTFLLAVAVPIAMAQVGRFTDGSASFPVVMGGPLIISSWLITPSWREATAISNGFGVHDTVRRATRWGSLIWIPLAGGSILIYSGLMTGAIITAVLGFFWGVICLACLLHVFLMFVCLERLGHWMRDEFACSMIRFIHLSLIVIAFGVLVGIIGPILFPISPGLFPVYSVIVFVVMMLMTVVLLITMSKTAWFSLLHNAENRASDRRLRERFDQERNAGDDADIRL